MQYNHCSFWWRMKQQPFPIHALRNPNKNLLFSPPFRFFHVWKCLQKIRNDRKTRKIAAIEWECREWIAGRESKATQKNENKFLSLRFVSSFRFVSLIKMVDALMILCIIISHQCCHHVVRPPIKWRKTNFHFRLNNCWAFVVRSQWECHWYASTETTEIDILNGIVSHGHRMMYKKRTEPAKIAKVVYKKQKNIRYFTHTYKSTKKKNASLRRTECNSEK